MRGRVARIYYSSRLDAERFASDVELPPSGGATIRLGSDPSNELVLPGRHVPGMVAALLLDGSSWWIEPFHGPCVVDGREARLGRRWPIRPGEEVRLGEFSLSLEDRTPSGPAGAIDREAASRQASELVAELHAALLPRLPGGRDSDSPQACDEHLLDVEHSIDELCGSAFRRAGGPLIDHLAGLGVRAEMLRRIIEAAGGDGPGAAEAMPGWSRLISVVPELERDLDRLIRAMDAAIGVSDTSDARTRIEALDRRFWTCWEGVGSPRLDLGARAYLARRYCKKEIKDLVFGFGPLEDLIRTPTVSEIMVNDSNHIFIEHDGVLKNSGRRFVSDAVTRSIIERIAAKVGRRIDRAQPIVDARMADGSRVNAVIPPIAVDGPSLTIRKFQRGGFTVRELVGRGSMTPAVARFLRAAVQSRRNILVSGGTGTGKTTLLNCLGGWIPELERIVTVEDTAELRLGHVHVVRLETRTRNLEGQGALTIRDLVRNALRMRPDRIIVGECRGGEALDMLQAMNTGHDGSLTTIHANSTADVIQRLEGMVLEAAPLPIPAIHRQVAAAVDLVVQIERRGDLRRISEVAELAGYDARRGEIRVRRLFDLDAESSRLGPTGSLPTFVAELIRDGGLEIGLFYGEDPGDGEEAERWT